MTNDNTAPEIHIDTLEMARNLLIKPQKSIVTAVRPLIASVACAMSGIILVYAVIMGPGFTHSDKGQLTERIVPISDKDIKSQLNQQNTAISSPNYAPGNIDEAVPINEDSVTLRRSH